jgi:hypothetical protein
MLQLRDRLFQVCSLLMWLNGKMTMNYEVQIKWKEAVAIFFKSVSQHLPRVAVKKHINCSWGLNCYFQPHDF